jgi:hypothetical protein
MTDPIQPDHFAFDEVSEAKIPGIIDEILPKVGRPAR